MSVSGGWHPYGRAAATALLGEIRQAKGVEALAPVTVVVASNQVGVSVRRVLASGAVGPVCGSGPGLIGVTFATPYRLAELLGAASLAADGRRPVSTPVLAAAVRTVLGAEPGVFAPVGGHPATEAALVAAYRELRDLTEDALVALAAKGRRAAEVVRVYRATRAHLVAHWYDEEDLMAAATTVAATRASHEAVGTLIAYLPQRLTRHAAELLVALSDQDHLSVVAGSTGVARADAEAARSVAALGLSDDPPPEGSVLASVVSPTTTRIITASDADDEVRAAVRQVIEAARAGTSLDRIAVLHAAAEPYGRLLHDHLDAAGVATNGAADVPLAGRLASRALLGLLTLPGTAYRRQDVFAWISGAPVLAEGHPLPVSAWERISRMAGVVGGRTDWDRLLDDLAERLNAEADQIAAEADEPQWRASRATEDAERARALRRFVLDLIDRLDAAAAGAAPWGERSRWAKDLLGEVLGGPSRRERWPDAERRAFERLELALERLSALDAVEGPVGLGVFTRTLTVELESDLHRTGRFGEGVLVGPLSMAVGVDLDLVILLGMAEGTFPATVRDDSLLPDDEREATGGELASRRGQVDRLHHQFLAVMSGADRQILCVPKGDLRRSRERVPSRWALDVASQLAGETWWSADLVAASVEWVTHIPSFDGGLRGATWPATAQEHRLRRLLAEAPTRRELAAVAASVDATLAGGVATVDARSSSALTRFDGDLSAQSVPSPADHPTSATRLEAWARCPHRYFMQHILRIEAIESPEDALQISPLDRGNLVHLALERFLTEVLAGEVPEPAAAWSPGHHRRLAEITAELCTSFEREGLTGRVIFWKRDRKKVLAELDRFLLADDHRRRHARARPIAAELAFGFEDAPPVLVPLGDGRSVAVRGRADRVDRGDDDKLHVIDYKTGKATSYKGLSAEDPHKGGQHLQLALYARAARQHVGDPDAPVRAQYWFTSAAEGGAEAGYDVSDEVAASVEGAVGTIVEGIEAGLFPQHPKPHGTSPFTDCDYCDPDGLGTTEALRRWERKAADPAMAPYLELVAPLSEGAEDR